MEPGTEGATEVTELLQAVISNEIDHVSALLKQKKIKVDEVLDLNTDQTALHVAAQYGHKDLVRLLVEEFGADIDHKDKRGDAAIHIASCYYHSNVVKYLVEKNSRYKEDVKEMLNDKEVDEFFDAVRKNDVNLVEEFIKNKNMDVNSVDKGDYYRTALHLAASSGFEVMVRALVDNHKANVNIQDELGELPLHNAADNGHINIVKFLAERNSDCLSHVADLLA